MKNCKNCKFWGRDFTKDEHNNSVCDTIELLESGSKEQVYIDADASDDSGLYARLVTNENFSCSLHQSH